MHYFPSHHWDADIFCIAAPGFGRAQAHQLLPLEGEEPEGEQIVSIQKKKKIGMVRMLEDKGGGI